MVKVLVLGASGFIGFPVATALARAGHVVYGLTRSSAKAKQLAGEEIVPIVGEVTEFGSWISIVASLDVVIDAVGGSAPIRTLSNGILSAVSSYAKSNRPSNAPKLSYIYSSGIWVHGEDRKTIVTDTSPITTPAELVAWRVEQEQRVVHDSAVNGIVIRPGLLIGKGGSLLAPLFKSAKAGKVAWYGTPGGRYSVVHCDDLAELYLAASEKARLCGGIILDACNSQTESVDDFLEKLVRVSGASQPYEYIKPSNLYETALGTTSLIRPYLAKAILGWEPRKPGLIDGLETYYAAYLALEEPST